MRKNHRVNRRSEGGVATETITFGFDGVTYEIDLNDKNSEAMRGVRQVLPRPARSQCPYHADRPQAARRPEEWHYQAR